MNNLRLIINFIALLILCPTQTFGVELPKVIKTYMQCIEELGSLDKNQTNRANELQLEIQHCFAAASHGGINIKDPDIYLIGAYNRNTITGQRYSIQLKLLIYDENSMNVNHQKPNTEIIMKPGYPKETPHLYQTTIKRQITFNGQTSHIWQKINVGIEDRPNEITKIVSSKTQFDNKSVTVDEDKDNMTASQLLDLAAEYYTKKKHKLAYDTYSRVTKKYGTNPDGWLELAIMTYYEQGYSHRNYRAKALEYLNKSLQYLTDDKKRKEAINFKMRIEHPNYY